MRGTLNNEVDSRFSRRNPDKAAAINAKNQATIEAGQREMAGLRQQRGLQSTIAPDHDPSMHSTSQEQMYSYSSYPSAQHGSTSALPARDEGRDSWGTPHGTVGGNERPGMYGQSDFARSYETGDTQRYTSTPNPGEGNSTADRIEKRMRKLMKRKP